MVISAGRWVLNHLNYLLIEMWYKKYNYVSLAEKEKQV